MSPQPANLWRISNHADLLGFGGLYGSGRWHTAGRRIVYLAESPPGALLEILVHLEFVDGILPKTYQLLKLELEVRRHELPFVELGTADAQTLEETRRIGDKWLASSATPLARVRSVIMPRTFNWLLNPLHPQAAILKVVEAVRTPFDPRLLRRL